MDKHTPRSRPSLLRTAQGTRPERFGLVDWGLLASVAAIWGSSFLFIALSLEGLPPLTIPFARLALAALALGLFPAARVPLDAQDRGRVWFLGATWMALPFILFPLAQQWIDSSLAGMLNGAMPLFAAVIAAALLRRAPSNRVTAGLIVGFTGVVLISLPAVRGAGSSLLGVLLVLTATISYAFAVNAAAPLQQRYGSLPVLWRAQLVACLLTFPFAAVSVGDAEPTAASLAAIAALGVLGTGLAFVAFATLVGRVGPTRGSVAIYFVPIVAIVVGVVFRSESVVPLQVLGTLIAIIGAWAVSGAETVRRQGDGADSS